MPIYKYQIIVMNYVGTNNQNTSQNMPNYNVFNQMNQSRTILGLISWALSTDFSRYSNLVSSKIYLEQLINSKNPHNSAFQAAPVRSQPSIRPKQSSQSAQKQIQKSKQATSNSVPKIESKTSTPIPIIPSSPAYLHQNSAKIYVDDKNDASKQNNQICKILVHKKENAGKMLRVNMIYTTELCRYGIGQRDKKKLKERILLRQIKQRPIIEEIKRERRDLRNLH